MERNLALEFASILQLAVLGPRTPIRDVQFLIQGLDVAIRLGASGHPFVNDTAHQSLDYSSLKQVGSPSGELDYPIFQSEEVRCTGRGIEWVLRWECGVDMLQT